MNTKFLFNITIVFAFFGCPLLSNAQVCSGSLGDPVINVNFGSGSGTGSPLRAASTSYNFTSSSCPDDGSYTVVSSTSGCFGNTWHTLSDDHTADDNSGYMMLINASYEPGDFYVDTVKGLCSNTTYEFAAWVVNVLLPSACSSSGITPNLTFNIETTSGTVLGTYTTGAILSSGTPTWKQYGLFFTTPVNAGDVVIRLTNNAPGGCGNDLALDDITFRPCGPTVTASVVNNSQTTLDFCKGNAPAIVPLIANVGNGYIAPSLQWQLSTDSGITWTDIAGATTLSYQFNKTTGGNYNYRLTVAEGANIGISSCRIASNVITIGIHDLPAVNVSGNSPVCEKQLINLSAAGGSIYEWKGPDGFISQSAAPSIVANSNSGGQYSVIVTDRFGCVNSDSVTVIINPKPVASVSGPQTFCEGDQVLLQAGGGTAYLWSPSARLSAANIPNPAAAPIDTTLYNVVVFNSQNCTDTATVLLNVLKKPVADAGPDKVILKGQTVVLEGKVSGTDVSFSWSPATSLANPSLLQPTAKPSAGVLYTLNVNSGVGCGTATDDVFVKVYNDIYIPNAFSPNNDGLNDTWRIDGLIAVPNARVLVYNRFGNIVFETVSNNQQWDGTSKGEPLAPGAYVYLIDLKNGMPLRKGTVVILR